MKGTAELKTERLLLRKYRPADAPALHREFGMDPVMYEYSGWNPYATEEMAAGTTARFIRSYADPTFYGWAAEAEGRLVGTVGAYEYDAENSSIEAGLSIARDCWGKGYSSEILACVLRYLTEQEGIRTVTAWCAADNIGSRKAMQKAGMRQTGTEPGALEIGGKKYDKLIFAYSVPDAGQ